MRILCLIALLVSSLVSCGKEEVRPVRIDLVVKRSCGIQPTQYDLSCVSSLEFRLLNASGRELKRQCTSVTGQFLSLQELVSTPTPSVLENVKVEDGVELEIRGYISADIAPCSNLSDSELLFWGRSDPTDLLDISVSVITVSMECRPNCDCEDIQDDPTQCPATLARGICAPTADSARCKKDCSDDCYGGALACGIDNLCMEAAANSICAPCTAGGTCASGICVSNSNSLAADQYCSDPCPPVDGTASPCLPSMSCKQLGPTYSTL
jgi:hypothetical protein